MKKDSLNIKSMGALLLIILVLMAGLIYINSTKSTGSRYAFKELKSLSSLGQLEAADKSSHVFNFDGQMIEANGAVIKARGINGEAAWSQTLLGQVGILKSSSSNLYVADGSKRLYCISRGGKLLWDKQLEGDINALFVASDGDVLVETRDSEGSKVKIISVKGVDEGSIILGNCAVLAFASIEGENAISIADVSAQTLKTRLITFDLKGSMTWSCDYGSEIVPMIAYGKDHTLIAIGEKTIYKYKGEGKRTSKLELDKTIYSADISDANIATAVKSRWGYDVSTYDMNFKEIGSLDTDKAPKGIILGKNNYILYYSESLIVCDLKGSAKSEFKSVPNINYVNFSSDGNIVVVSDRMLQKLSYK